MLWEEQSVVEDFLLSFFPVNIFPVIFVIKYFSPIFLSYIVLVFLTIFEFFNFLSCQFSFFLFVSTGRVGIFSNSWTLESSITVGIIPYKGQQSQKNVVDSIVEHPQWDTHQRKLF